MDILIDKVNNTDQKEFPFLRTLKDNDLDMDKLYQVEMQTIEPNSVSFGFTTFKDGDGSSDFKLRRMAEIMAKYAEYTQRLNEDKRNSSGFLPNMRSDWYKREVARRILLDNEVNTWALNRAINKKFGQTDSDRFLRACAVLQNYVESGGKDVINGTGLPNFTGKK